MMTSKMPVLFRILPWNWFYVNRIKCGDTVELRTGIFRKSTVKKNSVLSIDVRRGVFGSLFNYGNVVLNISGKTYSFRKMNRVLELERYFRE